MARKKDTPPQEDVKRAPTIEQCRETDRTPVGWPVIFAKLDYLAASMAGRVLRPATKEAVAEFQARVRRSAFESWTSEFVLRHDTAESSHTRPPRSDEFWRRKIEDLARSERRRNGRQTESFVKAGVWEKGARRGPYQGPISERPYLSPEEVFENKRRLAEVLNTEGLDTLDRQLLDLLADDWSLEEAATALSLTNREALDRLASIKKRVKNRRGKDEAR